MPAEFLGFFNKQPSSWLGLTQDTGGSQADLKWTTKPEALLGLSVPFALAVGDAATRSVWLARDPMGEAPLYYSITESGVWVGRDVDDLLAVSEISHDVDLDAVALRLAGVHDILTNRTDYRAIAKVPPGNVVRIDPRGVREIAYWSPELVGTERSMTFHEAVEAGVELLRDAVRTRLDPNGTAAHVSSGLDSGAVAAVAAQELQAKGAHLRLLTSWSPPGTDTSYGDPGSDERRLVAIIAHRLGVEVIHPARGEVVAAAARRPDLLSDPPAAWLVEQITAARAAREGVTTILTGWGGDEAISHHSRKVPGELARGGHILTAWRATEAPMGQHRSSAQRARMLGSGAIQPWHRGAAVSPTEQAIDELWRRYSPEIADARIDHVRRFDKGRTTREVMLNRIRSGHLAYRNESWARGGQALGLTYLHPLQDRRLVEFALSLPPEFFTFNGTHRRIFRAICAGLLPAEVIEAPKVLGGEPATRALTRDAVSVRLPLWRQEGEALGWPRELIDAWLGRLEVAWAATGDQL